MELKSKFIRKLPMPIEIKAQYPLTEEIEKIKTRELTTFYFNDRKNKDDEFFSA